MLSASVPSRSKMKPLGISERRDFGRLPDEVKPDEVEAGAAKWS